MLSETPVSQIAERNYIIVDGIVGCDTDVVEGGDDLKTKKRASVREKVLCAICDR